MQVVARFANSEELPLVWNMYVDSMKNHIEKIWGWDDKWQEKNFADAYVTSATYILEVDKIVSGYFQVDVGTENYLRMLILKAGARGKKIGARILAEILKKSTRSGKDLFLRVFKVNHDAKRFYEREGWKIADEDEVFYRMQSPVVSIPELIQLDHDKAKLFSFNLKC